jgi:7-cyano-7-deazaguanine synthase
MKAICVLSGGLDSAVTSMFAKSKNYDISTVTFNYGQMALNQEIKSAKKISDILNADHHVIDINFVKEFSESGLNTGNIPEPEKEDLDDFEKSEKTMKAVWVPARNMIMFSIASGFAEGIGAEKIFSGLNKEEGVTFPDNTTEFIERFNKSLEYGTLNKVKMVAPLYELNKPEIAKLGKELELKLDLEVLKYSYSCYKDNGKDYLHCGTCESCMRRKRAFKEAGITDPTKYIVE